MPGLVRLADVEAEHINWLWPGRIPLGKLTMIDGDPGLGKTLVATDLAARVSRGAVMPDGSVGDLNGAAGVVLLTAEDGLGDTVRPRLDAANADATRIVALTFVREGTDKRLPTLADLYDIRSAIAVVEARLVVVDPVMAYLPGAVNSYRDQDTRRLLAPLADLAQETGAAIVALRHLNKAPGGNPLYRGGGSIAFIGAARSGLLVAKDPDDENGERRILAMTKSNLAALPPALAYHIEGDANGVARIAWEGETSHTASLSNRPGSTGCTYGSNGLPD